MVERDEQLDRIFHALAHPARRDILRMIAQQEQTVGELAAPFDMSLEAVSKHIQVLERAELLRRTRSGRLHHCRLGPAPLAEAAGLLAELTGMWHERLDGLERFLAETESAEE